MALKRVKPTSQGRRFQEYSTFEEITETEPEKRLLRSIKKSGGRNAHGRMTIRYRKRSWSDDDPLSGRRP